eukprot:8021684-Ditylum_brightwellii.AAC.1
MESSSNNIRLWACNTQNFISSSCKKFMSGDLPLVETCFPVIVMKCPTKKIQQGNCAKAFVYDAVMLQ